MRISGKVRYTLDFRLDVGFVTYVLEVLLLLCGFE